MLRKQTQLVKYPAGYTLFIKCNNLYNTACKHSEYQWLLDIIYRKKQGACNRECTSRISFYGEKKNFSAENVKHVYKYSNYKLTILRALKLMAF